MNRLEDLGISKHSVFCSLRDYQVEAIDRFFDHPLVICKNSPPLGTYPPLMQSSISQMKLLLSSNSAYSMVNKSI